MKKYLKQYTENLSIIILLFYVLGFCYQFFYYQYFDIEIQYYITLTDIIFKSIGNLFTTLIIFLVIEVLIFIPADFFTAYLFRYRNFNKYEAKPHKVKFRLDRRKNYLISTNRKYYSFTLIIICLIAGAFIFTDSFYFYSIIIPNFLYHLYLIIEPPEEMLDVKMKKNITAIALFIVLVLIYSYWGYNDASCLKEQYTSKVISFDNVSTADNIYKYIGETSGYYFILNSQNNDVLVINKDGIDKVKVETNKFRENEQKQAQKKVDEFINKVKDFLDSNKR